VCGDEGDIRNRALKGQLSKVRGGSRYDVGKMDHSYPYLTRDSKRLLNQINRRFRKKAKEDGMLWPKFTVTSMTRTTESVKNLMKNNGNASENSPHMYGNAFDRIGNSTTFPEVFQHLPPIVNRNFPPGSSDLSWNPCLFP
jgi:hypothetical protein